MSRRRRAGNPVSLFPFVAVMASTMGALILLLLVISRQSAKARDAAFAAQVARAAAAAKSQPLPELPPLPGAAALPKLEPLPPHVVPPVVRVPLPPLPPVKDPRGALLARRAAIEKELAELRKRRERVPKAGEERLAPLMREAALLRDRIRQLNEERSKQAEKLKGLDRLAAELSKEKDEAAAKAKKVENRFAVVPYLGPNGTKRRPIFLECRADAIVLQPEGVVVQPKAWKHAGDTANPLASMVNALADVMNDGQQEGRPYPLLLVRPQGINTYYRARTALEFLRCSFGYELVPDDMELAFGNPNPNVKQLAETTLKTAEVAEEKRYAAWEAARERSLMAESRRGPGGSTNVAGRTLGGSGEGLDGGDGNDEGLPKVGDSIRDFLARHDAGPGGRLRMGALLQSDGGSVVAGGASAAVATNGSAGVAYGSAGGGNTTGGGSPNDGQGTNPGLRPHGNSTAMANAGASENQRGNAGPRPGRTAENNGGPDPTGQQGEGGLVNADAGEVQTGRAASGRGGAAGRGALGGRLTVVADGEDSSDSAISELDVAAAQRGAHAAAAGKPPAQFLDQMVEGDPNAQGFARSQSGVQGDPRVQGDFSPATPFERRRRRQIDPELEPQPLPLSRRPADMLTELANSAYLRNEDDDAGHDGRRSLMPTVLVRAKPKRIVLTLRAGVLQLGEGRSIAVGESTDPRVVYRALLEIGFREAALWPAPPKGRRWQPTFVIRTTLQDLDAAWRIQLGLVGTGLAIDHELVGSNGDRIAPPTEED